jgi:hypothetical protein
MASLAQQTVLAALNERVLSAMASLNVLRYYRIDCEREEETLAVMLAVLSPSAPTPPTKAVLKDIVAGLDGTTGWAMAQFVDAFARIESIDVDPEYAQYLGPVDEVRAAQLAKLSAAMAKRSAWIGGASGGEMARRSS